mmetsp:Transcript_14481/g.21263  ORF Transcript_14481/g.21263 Transcript_14481/m.21263 type:complete len:155 (+) Transcript_14481:106-570(+)
MVNNRDSKDVSDLMGEDLWSRRFPWTSQEMRAGANVLQMRCENYTRWLNEIKRHKADRGHPTAKAVRQAALLCANRTMQALRSTTCTEEYDALYKCYEKNPMELAKCRGMRSILDKCAAKKGLLEDPELLQGTMDIAKDLFTNTPTKPKFMKDA